MDNRNKYNLNKLLFQSNKNENNLDKKLSLETILNSSSEFFSTKKLIYDSDWVLCELEKFKEATTITYEELLPEKASYNFSVSLNIDEQYLPFLNFDVLVKTIPEQMVTGVGEFTFTSLREIDFKLYEINGVTSMVKAYWDYPVYEDTCCPWQRVLVGYEQTGFWGNPQPSGLYSESHEFFPDGKGYGTKNWHDYSWGLKYPASNFPVPISENPSYILPYGSYTPANPLNFLYTAYGWSGSPPESPPTGTFFWEQTGLTDFNGLINIYGYTEARAILNKYYPDIVVSEEDNPPYHAYEIIRSKTIKSCNQQILINKLGDNQFRIDVTGYFLLLSKAITETIWSDSENPTYEPNGEDLFSKLKVYFNPSIKTKKLINYNK